MLAVISLPCLNEGQDFLPTCASLGFAQGSATPSETVLVLVDNGSSDDTLVHMEVLAAELPQGSVIVVEEPERGYVSARQAGATAAEGVAFVRGMEPAEVLLLQADADTVYAPGYVEAMRRAAVTRQANLLFEGRSEGPSDPQDPVRRFQAAEAAADAEVAKHFAPDVDDVIVDDKVAAFRLADYFKWGGHQEEFDREGNEILAETSRLFIRARGLGAKRVRVDDAEAHTSDRRLREAPDIAFATAGYPRPPAWKERWRSRYQGPTAFEAFQAWPLPAGTDEVLAERRRHVLAMFVEAPRLAEASRHGSGPHNAAGYVLDEALQRATHNGGRHTG